MKLTDRNGMTLVSESDLQRLHNLKTLFKQHRDTVATAFKFSKDNRPITNLLSKLWRISDDIMEEIRHIGEVENASIDCKDTGDLRR
jgi:hypothetical protein